MGRSRLLELTPSLLLAAGILVASALAVATASSDVVIFSAPLLLALTVLAADVLESRLRGSPLRPTPAAWMLAASFLIAGLIVGIHDPEAVKTLMPLLGATACTVLVVRAERRRQACRPVE